MLERAPTLQMEVAKLRPILWLGLCNTRRLRLHLRGAPEPKLSSLPRSDPTPFTFDSLWGAAPFPEVFHALPQDLFWVRRRHPRCGNRLGDWVRTAGPNIAARWR